MAKVALLIGVSEYEVGLNPLPAAVKDVVALERILKDSEMGDFDEVKILTNPEPQEMQYEVETLFSGRSKDDFVLLFFSGHGIKDDNNNLYFATRITKKSAKGDLIRSTAVPARFLHDVMNNSRAKRQAIILDCCFSGAFDPSLQSKDDGSVDLQGQLGAEGRVVLTSSSSTQYSFEQQGSDLSLYTRYLIEGIETGAGDLDEDGKISVRELHDYATSKVQETAPSMTPKLITLKDMGFDLVLAKAKVTDPKLRYRKTATRYASTGIIRPSARAVLNTLRQQLGLTIEDAAEIESEVLRPYQARLANLQQYRETLIAEAEHEYPLSEFACEDLNTLQQMLGLRDEDVLPIQQEVKAQFTQQSALKDEDLSCVEQPSALQPVKPRDSENVARVEQPLSISKEAAYQDELDKLQAAGSKSNSRSQNIADVKFQHFEFDVITVDKKGKENSRTRKTAEFFAEDLGNGVLLEMVKIPEGTFLMGMPEGEKQVGFAFANNINGIRVATPQHSVMVPSLCISKYPITQSQWRAVAALPQVEDGFERDPSHWKGDNRPVELVSSSEAIEFCQRLSLFTRHQYRLLNEAEWEYACRAGIATPFYFGETITPSLANCSGATGVIGSVNSLIKAVKGEGVGETTPVGSYLPNSFGLYDMHGNVFEWCADYSHDNYAGAPTDGTAWMTDGDNEKRVVRGGSFLMIPGACRSAHRMAIPLKTRAYDLGFRVACSIL
ncbi:hypothetical protein APA_275 [Pseudanabaena sp. lw0831]|uniref:caspase, EACC1-associated type n=1 Tax=Pseudanabaena sp. lw0831 TaxID=1357935 RepID=UPI0019155D5E|nr:SUMF1/EgtB/PvdO family nonheme iron enzyme [Pseudanabaena sp. lw0831]GBO52606.1 hypothetical protein APA_275 [Pseudanabaena sp. lw0831]